MKSFDVKKDHDLEDKRVKLQLLKTGHYEGLAEISNDRHIWTYLQDDGSSPEKLKNHISVALENRILEIEYSFLVIDKDANRIVRTTRFYEINSSMDHLKLGHTWYGSAFRGSGINTHCKYLLFKFAFEQLGAYRIGFDGHAQNARSTRALEKVGCSKEDVLRSFLKMEDNQRADITLMSILKEE